MRKNKKLILQLKSEGEQFLPDKWEEINNNIIQKENIYEQQKDNRFKINLKKHSLISLGVVIVVVGIIFLSTVPKDNMLIKPVADDGSYNNAVITNTSEDLISKNIDDSIINSSDVSLDNTSSNEIINSYETIISQIPAENDTPTNEFNKTFHIREKMLKGTKIPFEINYFQKQYYGSVKYGFINSYEQLKNLYNADLKDKSGKYDNNNTIVDTSYMGIYDEGFFKEKSILITYNNKNSVENIIKNYNEVCIEIEEIIGGQFISPSVVPLDRLFIEFKKEDIKDIESVEQVSVFNRIYRYHLIEQENLLKEEELKIKQTYVNQLAEKGEEIFINEVMIDKFNGRYHGTIAIIISDTTTPYPDAELEEDIDGVLFKYNNFNKIVIWNDDVIYSLTEAYEKNIVTKEDLEYIAFYQKYKL